MKRICFFADVQYAPVQPRIGRMYDQGRSRLIRILEATRNEVDLYVNLGDFINGEEAYTSYAEMMSLCDSVGVDEKGGPIPFIHVPGNHDGFALPNEQLRGSGFSVHVLDDVHFIVLDGNYDWNGNPYGGVDGDWTKCLIPQEQVDALKAELATCTSAVVLCHYVLDPRDTLAYTPKNVEEVRRILEESGKVQAVFQGHYHEGFEQVYNGIPYHTIPGVCENIAGNGKVLYATVDVEKGVLKNYARHEC